MKKKTLEQTLILIKPDAMKNSLTGYVMSQLSEYHSGLRFAGIKVAQVSTMLAEEHYAEHKGKVFYPSLIEFITGRLHYPNEPSNRRVMAIVFSGPNAVKKLRDIVGPTNPHTAREEKPGCIRSLGTVVPIYDESGKMIGDRIENLVHASATQEEAEREIKLWFRPADIPPFMHTYPTGISEENYYIKGGRLHTTRKPGSICLVSKGDTAWKSDLKALALISKDRKSTVTIEAVTSKYLINSLA